MAGNPVHFERTPAKTSMPGWYPELLSSVVEHISTGRLLAHAAVNQGPIVTYWAIGRDFIERMDQEGWGARVVDRLSREIREHFPEARGYTVNVMGADALDQIARELVMEQMESMATRNAEGLGVADNQRLVLANGATRPRLDQPAASPC